MSTPLPAEVRTRKRLSSPFGSVHCTGQHCFCQSLDAGLYHGAGVPLGLGVDDGMVRGRARGGKASLPPLPQHHPNSPLPDPPPQSPSQNTPKAPPPPPPKGASGRRLVGGGSWRSEPRSRPPPPPPPGSWSCAVSSPPHPKAPVPHGLVALCLFGALVALTGALTGVPNAPIRPHSPAAL